MGNLFASFNTGVSGLHSRSHPFIRPHNIANATTEGYSRQQVIVTDAFYSTRYGAYANRLQIGKGTDIAEIRQVRKYPFGCTVSCAGGTAGVFMRLSIKPYRKLKICLERWKAEEFITSVTDLWSAVSNLAQEPNNIVLRSELVSTASKFTERANALRDRLVEYQTNMNQEVKIRLTRSMTS